MKLITSILLTFVATLAMVWLALVFTARTGAVDVASTADYVPGAEWFFSTLSQQSIRRHARHAAEAGEIAPPTEVTEAMLQTGATHYGAMCVVCHGGPGLDRGELGQGLKPEPPELSHAAREMSETEILWVLHHGIRHTGMPAFGKTHSPEELQAITALVARLDGMSPDQFQRLSGSAASGGHGHDHGDHGEGSAGSMESGHGHSVEDGHGHATSHPRSAAGGSEDSGRGHTAADH